MPNKLQHVQATYAALLQRGDLEAFLAAFDDDSRLIEADSLPYGGTFQGREAIRGLIQKMMTLWKSIAFDIEKIVEDGDWVMAYGTFTATAARSGKTASFPLVEVWKFDGDRLEWLRPIYSDVVAACEALR